MKEIPDEVTGRMGEFTFTTPTKHYGIVIDGFMAFHGSEKSMRAIASQIENGERGPIRPASLVCIEIKVIRY